MCYGNGRIYLRKSTYSAAIQKAATANFREFCNRQGKEDVWSLTNRLLSRAPLPQPAASLFFDGTFTTSSLETARRLLDDFYPDDDSDTLPEHHLTRTRAARLPNTPNDVQFGECEILTAVKEMNPNKAPGVDHLTSDIVSAVCHTAPGFIYLENGPGGGCSQAWQR